MKDEVLISFNRADTMSAAKSWQGGAVLIRDLAKLIYAEKEDVLLQPLFSEALRMSLMAVLDIAKPQLTKKQQPVFFYTDMDHSACIHMLRWCGAQQNIPVHEIKISKQILSGEETDTVLGTVKTTLHGHAFPVLFISHIDPKYGVCFSPKKLDEIMPRNGVLLLDAAQSLGQVDENFPMKKPAVILGSGHKWIGALRGSAFAVWKGPSTWRKAMCKALSLQPRPAFSLYNDVIDPEIERKQGYDFFSVDENSYRLLASRLNIVLREGGVAENQQRVRDNTVGFCNIFAGHTWRPVILPSNAESGIRFLRRPANSEISCGVVAEKLRTKFNILVRAFNDDDPGIRVCISEEDDPNSYSELALALDSFS